MRKIITLLLLVLAQLASAQTFYNITALNTVNTPKVDYTDVQTWSSVGAVFNVSGSISTASDGVSANWKEGYDHSPISLNYSNPTLTLTRKDGTTLTTTINTGGGDFVPITGNVGNPMTGPLVMQKINTSDDAKSIVIGNLIPNPNNGYNVQIGLNAGKSITTGVANVVMGINAGQTIQDGSSNVIIGNGAAIDFNSTNNTNTAIGAGAGGKCKGSGNVFVGSGSGFSELNTGTGNIFIGENSVSTGSPQQNYSGVISIGKNNGIGPFNSGSIVIGSNITNGGVIALTGESTGTLADNFIKINGEFFVQDWGFKQVAAGLNIYYNSIFKMRLGTDGDLYLSGTAVHYNATE